ncbi:hypothetical protein [Streptomyces heilongjiangensis]|uniref:Uncharacterized protein n=1 Tax=Streptomyces heilongjiangensis TaxID=945052 RepID=A0ABW1BFG0_9ACTN|nr:hypothetical protein [Streptomyces heilongjiangensis]MDC2951888.1 hypothetical protein [Streptomyces heilongjiangensis]
MAISRDGALLGGGFFVTRYFALTATACLSGAAPGDPVELHTAMGSPLRGVVVEVASGLGLALVGVIPDAAVDYAIPQLDHAVKGDRWKAPYRPGPTKVLLSGTVDDVTEGAGNGVSVIELTSDQGPGDYTPYAGGPVERRAEGQRSMVMGMLLEPEFAGSLRDGAEELLAAAAIDSVIEAFEGLAAEHLVRGLRGETPPADPLAGCARGGAGEEVSPDGVARAFDRARRILRGINELADEGLVDPRDLVPYQIRMLDEIVGAAEDESD